MPAPRGMRGAYRLWRLGVSAPVEWEALIAAKYVGLEAGLFAWWLVLSGSHLYGLLYIFLRIFRTFHSLSALQEPAYTCLASSSLLTSWYPVSFPPRRKFRSRQEPPSLWNAYSSSCEHDLFWEGYRNNKQAPRTRRPENKDCASPHFSRLGPGLRCRLLVEALASGSPQSPAVRWDSAVLPNSGRHIYISLSLYIYIYIHLHMCIYIYIYIYV